MEIELSRTNINIRSVCRFLCLIRYHLKGTALGAAFVTLGTSLLIQGLNIITGILTARFLGPNGKGELTAIILWPTLISAIGSLGLAGSITFFAAKDKQNKKIFGTSTLLGLFQSIVLIGLGLLIIPTLLEHQGSKVVQLALLYLLFIPLNLLTIYQQSVLGGRLDFTAYNLIRITFVTSSFFGIVTLAYLNLLSLESAVWVYLISNLLTLGITTILAGRASIISAEVDKGLIRPMVTYGIKSHLASISLIVNERVDQAVISIFLLSSQLGYYSVAVTLTTPVVIIGTSLASVVLPTLSSLSQEDKIRHQLTRYVRYTFWSSLLVSSGMVVFIPWLIEVFFGDSFLAASNVATILLLAAVPLSLNRVLQACLKAINAPFIAGIGETSAAVITVLLLLVFLPSLGIIGAGLVSLTAYSISLVFMVGYLANHYEVSVLDMALPKAEDKEFIATLFKKLANRLRK